MVVMVMAVEVVILVLMLGFKDEVEAKERVQKVVKVMVFVEGRDGEL